MVQMEFPRLEEFLIELQKSWEEAMKLIKVAQENIKKQFDKKKRNPQELKIGDNVWLDNKNIYSNRLSKKLDQKTQFKEQYIEPALLPMIINKEEEYEVKEVKKHKK